MSNFEYNHTWTPLKPYFMLYLYRNNTHRYIMCFIKHEYISLTNTFVCGFHKTEQSDLNGPVLVTLVFAQTNFTSINILIKHTIHVLPTVHNYILYLNVFTE